MCRVFSVLTIVAMGATACVASVKVEQTDSNYSASANPHIRLFANVLQDAVWLNRAIFVCWENLSQAYAPQADAVRAAVAGTWEKESSVRFVGWQACAADNAGVRVRIDDAGPHTKRLGRRLDRLPNGMVLNFEFKNWNLTCADTKPFCIRVIAVHEFGHALGFAHEQNRFDAPGECQQLKQGTTGDLLLTPYDPMSVMNYCNAKYNNNGALSDLDVKAVREIYGAPVG
jgi:hypothetical protein